MTASVVQTKAQGQPNGTDPWVPTATLASTPTQGNLLYAVVFLRTGGTAPTAASGWTLDQSGSYPYVPPAAYIASYWKYAGASEPTTVTPNTSSGSSASIVVWEITGVSTTFSVAKLSGSISIAIPGGNLGTSTSSNFNTLVNNALLLDAWLCYTQPATSPGTVGVSPFTAGSTYNAVGGSAGATITAIGANYAQSSYGNQNDTFTTTVATNFNSLQIALASVNIPVNTQGVSKINAWGMVGPPTGVQVVSKITGYTMVGPAPPFTGGWISVME